MTDQVWGYKDGVNKFLEESGGGSSAFVVTTVTLTDAQIKALPTTPVLIVAAPGASNVLVPTFCAAHKDFTAAGYTNVGDSAGNTYLAPIYGNSIHPGANGEIGSIYEVQYSIFSDASVETYILPTGANEDGNGTVFPPGGRDLRNLGIYVYATNHASGGADLGAFTGGDPANTLSVTVYSATLAV